MKKIVLVMLTALVLAVFVACDNEVVVEEVVSEPEVLEEVETPEIVEEKLVFELVAGEQGEYGKLLTYNAGTEFEENFYAFYVPAGTYTVTNVGEYMSQINVYSDEMHKTEEGWEEPAETIFVKLIDVGNSEVVTINAGQHVEIAEPSKFKFEQQ